MTNTDSEGPDCLIQNMITSRKTNFSSQKTVQPTYCVRLTSYTNDITDDFHTILQLVVRLTVDMLDCGPGHQYKLLYARPRNL